MKIINYAKTHVSVRLDTFGHIGPVAEFDLNHGGEWERGIGKHDASIKVVATRPGGFYKVLFDDLNQKWLNTSVMIITPKDSPRIVDFKSRLQAWQGNARKLVTDEREEAAKKVFEFFAAFLSALAASSSALGPLGAPGAGAGSLLSALISGGSPTPPTPDIDQIEKVVRSVVSSELDKNNATHGKSAFDLVAQRYVALCSEIGDKEIRDLQNPDNDEKKLLAELLDFVDQFGEYDDSQGFTHYLNLFRQNPSISKYGIVAFSEAVAMYLDIRRLKVIFDSCDTERLNDGTRFPKLKTMRIQKHDVELFQGEVVKYAQGLREAKDALQEVAANELDALGLRETGRYGELLRAEIYKCVCGSKDLSPIDTGVADLGSLAGLLSDEAKASEYFGSKLV